MKKLSLIMALFAMVALAACNKDKDNDDNNDDNNNPPAETKGVVINELMTKDTKGLVYVDGQGDASDWVEIYNASDKDINIGGYYLTDDGKDDDPANLWEIPTTHANATTVKAGKYLVIVFGAADASGADMDGIVNDTIFCPSGLSTKKDVAVALFDTDKKLVDESENFTAKGPFGALEDDKSLGRESDGKDTWKVFETPTPGAQNK
jgi:hypothetical protein